MDDDRQSGLSGSVFALFTAWLERVDPGTHRRIKGLRLVTAYGIAAALGTLAGRGARRCQAAASLGSLAAAFALWASVSEGKTTRAESSRDLALLSLAAALGALVFVVMSCPLALARAGGTGTGARERRVPDRISEAVRRAGRGHRVAGLYRRIAGVRRSPYALADPRTIHKRRGIDRGGRVDRAARAERARRAPRFDRGALCRLASTPSMLARNSAWASGAFAALVIVG